MHIIIPMSGVGNRFIEAGYKTPKPLIVIDGKPIIEHVCDLFPNETKFTFICNAKHLAETNMREILHRIKPNGNIIEIPNHKKGPVYAVYAVRDLIEDEEETIVNYCDFGSYWDYSNFLEHTRNRNADGAVVAYKGFHPHMLGSTNYAFMRDDKQWMLEIKEKEPFTNNRMQEYASNGTYYFKKGAYVKKYFKELMDKDINLKGEYYVSLVYNLLVQSGLKVSIYEIQHMLQWGTPRDVAEYNGWSSYFRQSVEHRKSEEPKNEINLIPLAGRGSRFEKAGYELPKPLIEVGGKPMIVQASNSLPASKKYIFICLKDHLEKYPLRNILKDEFTNSEIVVLDKVTEGQAITCASGLENVPDDNSLLIAATDNGMIYNDDKYKQLVLNEETDAIIFTFRHHTGSENNPQMYGWVRIDNDNNALEVSVKTPISDRPFEDHAVVGTFWFKKVEYYKKALSKLLEKNIRINGEYYVDSLMNELIAMGCKVKILEVDHYVCWGTPDDYKTFVYWQSFFHKVSWHPYSLDKDHSVPKSRIQELDKSFRMFEQKYI